jgi:chemotaxis protein methyltransferase CheR
MGLAARTELAVPDREFLFTWADFHAIASLVREESGIVLPENKAALVYSRLSKRLRSLGLSTFQDYCEMVEQDGGAEREALIAAMTTNVTRFFREDHHFDHLRAKVLPTLIDAARNGARIRIWSAACSSGEEPYSIALTLLEAMPDAGACDILILASDIDPHMIATGRAGVYPATRLNDIPQPLRRNIEKSGDQFRFDDAVRNLVRFRQLNLLRPWPFRGGFQAIFCRNVMIYFDQPTQDGIWDRFADVMSPGGLLYIGHSERIASAKFSLVAQTTYRKAPP